MVEQARRQKKKRKLLGSHQKCWVWGRHAVLEILQAGRWVPLEMQLSSELDETALQEAHKLAEPLGIPISVEAPAQLQKTFATQEHQGYLAKMPPYPYAEASDILQKKSATALYAVLDRIQDPYNFGAIIRAAEVFGLDAIFVATGGQCEVTSLVARSSAGAVNHIEIAQVVDLLSLIDELRQLDVRSYAAVGGTSTTIETVNCKNATAVVIGNEGIGIDQRLAEACDERVTIPQFGQVDSLNAAVAAGILFYEARRQRKKQTG